MKKTIALLSLAVFGYIGNASAQDLIIANKSHCPETVVIYAHEPGFPCGSLVSNPIPVSPGTGIPLFAAPAINDASCGAPGSIGVGWVGGACASPAAIFDGGEVVGVQVGNSPCYPMSSGVGAGCGSFPSMFVGWTPNGTNWEIFFHN